MRFLTLLTDIVLVSTVLSSIRRATDIEFPVHRIRNAMARWFVMQLLGMGDVVVDLIIEIVKQNPKLFMKRVGGGVSGNNVRGDGGALNTVAGAVGVGQPMLVELPQDGVSDTHQQVEIDGTPNHLSPHENDGHTHHMMHVDRNIHHNYVVPQQQQHVQHRGRSMSRTRLPSTHLHQQPPPVSISSTRSSPIPQFPSQVSQVSPSMQAYQPSQQTTRYTGTPTTPVTNSRCASPSHQNQLNLYTQPGQYQQQQYQPVVYGYQHRPPSRHQQQQQSQLSGDVKSKIKRRNVSRSQSPRNISIDDDDDDVTDTPSN